MDINKRFLYFGEEIRTHHDNPRKENGNVD